MRAGASLGQAPWTSEDLERLRLQEELEDESLLGEAWRSRFEDQMEALFTHAEEDEQRWLMAQEAMDRTPKAQWQEAGLLEAANMLSPALVNELIGLGTWRLKGNLDPAIAFLAQRIEGTWREAFMDDLSMYPREAWKARFSICDSMDPGNELQGWSYSDVPDPEPGQPGFPRLLLENRIYCSRVFRKMHLEVACRQDALQVLHMVMYPRYKYDLPILAMDLVVVKGVVTLAIVDACPVRANKYLPPHYLQTMVELQRLFLPDSMKARTIPDWGKEIFSPACVCIRPESGEDLAGFLKYAVALHRAHCALATLVSPVAGTEPQQQARLQELLQGHKRFVDNQLANKKTSRVLEVAFGPEWTSTYMNSIMFDFSPENEPPCENTSLVQLYRYFEQHPEVGNSAEQLGSLEADVALKRSEEVLSTLAAGEPVRQDRVEAALQVLYDLDPEFQDNCDVLFQSMGDAAPSDRSESIAASMIGDVFSTAGFEAASVELLMKGHGSIMKTCGLAVVGLPMGTNLDEVIEALDGQELWGRPIIVRKDKFVEDNAAYEHHPPLVAAAPPPVAARPAKAH